MRNAAAKPFISRLLERIDRPSRAATIETTNEKGEKIRVPLNPFDILIAGEDSLAVLMAQNSGIVFRNVPRYVEKNAAMGEEGIKAALVKTYNDYKEAGSIPADFDAEAEVQRFCSSIRSGIASLKREIESAASAQGDHAAREHGKGGHGGGRRRY